MASTALLGRRRFAQRLLGVVTVAALACTPVLGQGPAPVEYPYGLDPYEPTDAELLRRYGSVLVAQTPLLELHKLDPYKPSHAALLRDLGGAIPLWVLWYPPGPIPASLTPFPMTTGATGSAQVGITILVGQLPPDAGRTAPSVPAPLPTQEVVTALRPETNDGMWISYAGARWISAGPAVRFDESRFMRIGQYDGFPVFRPRDAGDDVIYLPTRRDLVAPYRLKSR